MNDVFQFDEEATLDAMAFASNVDLTHGQVTLYAIVCIGSGEAPHFSHGGQLSLDAQEVISAAKRQNAMAALTEADCRYLPAAVGIDPGELIHLARMVVYGGIEEPGDDD